MSSWAVVSPDPGAKGKSPRRHAQGDADFRARHRLTRRGLIWINVIHIPPVICVRPSQTEKALDMALILILHIFIGSTIAGSAVIAVLAMGYDTLTPILIAAIVGFFAAFPVSYVIGRKIDAQ